MHARHLVVFAALAAACRAEPKPQDPPAAAPPAPPPVAALTAADLLHATYPIRFVENDHGRATFTDSVYVDQAAGVRAKLLHAVPGELDGDGRGDGVAVVAVNFGGTGTFVSAVPVLNRDGAAVPGGAAGLGDRTNVRAVTIDSGTVRVDMVAAGPGDAACCPTDTLSQRFRLVGDSLVLQP